MAKKLRKPASAASQPPSKNIKPGEGVTRYLKSEQGQADMQGNYEQDTFLADKELEDEIKNAPPLPADEDNEEQRKKKEAQKNLMKYVQGKVKLKVPNKGK